MREAYFASRAMLTMEILAFGPATVTQLADELQVHSRTARRLVNRMVHDGWLVRHDGPRPRYEPTLRMVALAAQFAARSRLIGAARPVVADLSRETGGAVHLVIPSYRDTLRLLRAVDGGVAEVRDLAPAHATAAGKLVARSASCLARACAQRMSRSRSRLYRFP
jgi:DNA-binding IclR family transcriptional regulator